MLADIDNVSISKASKNFKKIFFKKLKNVYLPQN